MRLLIFYMYICRILLIQLLGCHIEINAYLVIVIDRALALYIHFPSFCFLLSRCNKVIVTALMGICLLWQASTVFYYL